MHLKFIGLFVHTIQLSIIVYRHYKLNKSCQLFKFLDVLPLSMSPEPARSCIPVRRDRAYVLPFGSWSNPFIVNIFHLPWLSKTTLPLSTIWVVALPLMPPEKVRVGMGLGWCLPNVRSKKDRDNWQLTAAGFELRTSRTQSRDYTSRPPCSPRGYYLGFGIFSILMSSFSMTSPAGGGGRGVSYPTTWPVDLLFFIALVLLFVWGIYAGWHDHSFV